MFLSLFLSLSLSLSLSFSSYFCWSVHVPSSLWSNVSKVTRLWGRSLMVFYKCICLCHCLCLCICLCICLFLVRSCPLISLIKCLKGDKSLGSLWCCVFKRRLSESVSEWVSDKVTYWAVGWTAKKPQHEWLLLWCLSFVPSISPSSDLPKINFTSDLRKIFGIFQAFLVHN